MTAFLSERMENCNGVNLLSNTTMWWRDILLLLLLLLLLHREQLHISALDNGRLQVLHESICSYTKIHIYIYIYGLLIWG